MNLDDLREAQHLEALAQHRKRQQSNRLKDGADAGVWQLGQRDPGRGSAQVSAVNGGSAAAKVLYNSSSPPGAVLKAGYANSELTLDARNAKRRKTFIPPSNTQAATTRGGLVMWLDVNWYFEVFGGPDQVNADKFFGAWLDFFEIKTLYVTPQDDPRVYREAGSSVGHAFLARTASIRDLTVVEALPAATQGAYFAPLLSPGSAWTGAEFNAIRQLALQYGGFIEGEWYPWTEFDKSTLLGLDLTGVTYAGADGTFGRHTIRQSPQFPPNLPATLRQAASGYFAGLRADQIVATTSEGNPSFAYFSQADLAG